MKISIITICFNSCNTIIDAIESVLQQTYTNLEYIIIDGNSSDNTMNIVRSYASKFEEKKIDFSYFSEKDEGLYDALNKGLLHCTGDVIGILHSDDVFNNNQVLEIVANNFNPDHIDAIYGDLVYVNKNAINKVIRYWKSKSYSNKDLIKGWMPAHPTFFVKSSKFKELGNYNIKYRISADYDLMLRFLLNNNFNAIYLPLLITRMRIGGESNQSLKKILIKMSEDIKILKSNNIFWPRAMLLKNILKLFQFFNL